MNIHTPSNHCNVIIRCLEFIISPVKVYGYYCDGFDVCAQCGLPIAIPVFYNSITSSFIYFLAGFLASNIAALVENLMWIITISLTLIFHHVYSSFVFACGQWCPYEPSQKRNRDCIEQAKKGLTQKVLFLSAGLMIGVSFHIAILH